MRHSIRIATIICITVFALALQGCMNAALTGAGVAMNHHNIQKTLDDQYITTQAYRKIYNETNEFNEDNISISTFHRKVLVAGQVNSRDKKTDAEQRIKEIPNIDRIYNLTEVSPPTSAITRMSDAWITAKIKAKLIANNDIDPDQIKVVTENGTVYLMGTLLTDQADIAAELARSTAGVQNVVKIFTYLQIVKR